MSMSFGNIVARNVRQAKVFCPTGSWVQLVGVAGASAPLTGRAWIRIAPRGRDTIALALKYVLVDSTGAYTTPTSTAHDATVIASTSIHVEPIGDSVAVFGRAVQRGGSSGGISVVVTEYA